MTKRLSCIDFRIESLLRPCEQTLEIDIFGNMDATGNEIELSGLPTLPNKRADISLLEAECKKQKPNLVSRVHHKWRKILKRDVAEITKDDPSHRVTYLGNVVTTWAKGEGCLDRPASALWKNHVEGRGSIKMDVRIAASGLKAYTREHGLTEYWSNRLTWCGVPTDYPKFFCWIYRYIYYYVVYICIDLTFPRFMPSQSVFIALRSSEFY